MMQGLQCNLQVYMCKLLLMLGAVAIQLINFDSIFDCCGLIRLVSIWLISYGTAFFASDLFADWGGFSLHTLIFTFESALSLQTK